jgi:hypothetical protein
VKGTPIASARYAKYEAAALYLLLFALLFGVHIANSDVLFPDPDTITAAPIYADGPSGCDAGDAGLATTEDQDDDLP